MIRCFFVVLFVILCHGCQASVVNSNLEVIARQAAGIYRQPTAYSSHASNIVLLTESNHGYLNHLSNFVCFLNRLNFKALIFSMDEDTHRFVSNTTGLFSYHWKGWGEITGEATTFRSPQFHILTSYKMEVALAVMKLGFDVLYVDPDIALVRDPIPQILFKNVDYVHSVNKICPQCDVWDFYKTPEEGNTGFYFVRSTPNTQKMFSLAIADVEKHRDLDDQSILWENIRRRDFPIKMNPLGLCKSFAEPLLSKNHSKTSLGSPAPNFDGVTTCHLDGCMFSAGALRGVAYVWLRDNLKKRNEVLYSVHANYLKGNDLKKKALEKHGYWLTTANPVTKKSYGGSCKPFTPYF